MYPSGQDISANDLIKKYSCHPAIVRTMTMNKSEVDSVHSHPWHQLVFPLTGLLQTQVGEKMFLVPHTTSIFVPAHVEHESLALSHTHFMGIYINPDFCRSIEAHVSPLFVSDFTKLLFIQIETQFNSDCYQHDIQKNLVNVLLDQVETTKATDFQLVVPKDRRIKQMFDCYNADPSIPYTLDDWSNVIGATKRTLTRLFAKEFGTSFSLWRQHIRLVISLSLLENNCSIQETAIAVGYQNDSSYIKAFKARFGITPLTFKNNSTKL
ncbi:transcriptional regulator [Vibrio ishigakensis]|uniref:Transcriptional regulator n=1 Tax=Vibrio ishigakensis TaxID=1481914 RepID=A0A0B8P541_9VIBR|nr:transcriptional regulator [Vibrio ishigakensis]